MLRFLRSTSWSGADGPRPRSKAATTVLTLALLSWWLWGDAAWDHVQAVGGQLRDLIVEAEPDETRLRVANIQIDAARDEAKRLAEVIGGIEVRIEALDRKNEQARDEQAERRALLAEFQKRLTDVCAGDVILVNGKPFDRSDVEHEAELCLDRLNAVAARLENLEARRGELVDRKASLQTALRDHLRRVRKLDLNQERIRALKEQQEFAQWIDEGEGWRADGEALSKAEQTQRELLHEFEAKERARRIIDEQVNGPAAPVADELRRELNPQTPLVERISQTIGG